MTARGTDRPARRPGRRRSVLVVLAGFLLCSGAIRVGIGLQDARALVPEPGPALSGPAGCAPPPLAQVEAFRLREERIAAREVALETRLSELAEAEALLRERLQDLEEAEAAISETLARADGAAEADLVRLTEVYEAMKPKDAALLFEVMAPEFAAGFLARMRPEAAAAVLSGMDPGKAYAMGVLLAGRNALVPRE
ncbi:MAG: MotE family protein [Gemmobacter sp.]